MTTAPRCPECGDTRRLNPSGVCAWRAGCEHRQMVSEARMADLDRMLATRPTSIDSALVAHQPADIIDLARFYLDRLSEDARARGWLPPGCEFRFDLSPLLDHPDDQG